LALQTSRLEAAGKQAHTLKGSTGNVGAMTMRQAALSLETAAAAGDAAQAAICFQSLESEFARFQAALAESGEVIAES
jgi:two-component system, sensor histidine kinase and response regulator